MKERIKGKGFFDEKNQKSVFVIADAINVHFDSSESCGSYSEQDIDTGEAHCLSYGEDIIHHDAVYERIYYEPEYTTIYHPEEIKEYQVWVND